ncbi:ribose-5-phosphate isomerase RpiA [Pseudomonas tructae]|uniref:Ribose-5-phosphate isomerase A n=1 Tax=Pseudomonas tructae TaxID=2518644 RepID=A0A411MIY7_9PSED|nr:ribose-5-phosphate isomerase RpiA [Pseudomonas tructae]QBF26739.1 ribose-5-phosphate isomerase RpiA [Pseudomonas tructae]
MPDLEAQKQRAALKAVEEVRDDMVVGLGSGSTAAYAVREIGRRMTEEGLKLTATATSSATGALAVSVGIPLRPMGDLGKLDLVIDGADEIDAQFRAIKGGGGALFRERIAAAAASQMIVIVDSSKLVERLGRFALPVEVHPFALGVVEQRLARYGVPATLRLRADGTVFWTDQQAHIFDISFGKISNPDDLAKELQAVPGILAHGLFLTLIDKVVVGLDNKVDVLERAKNSEGVDDAQAN